MDLQRIARKSDISHNFVGNILSQWYEQKYETPMLIKRKSIISKFNVRLYQPIIANCFQP